MFKICENRYSFGDLGLVHIPDNLERSPDNTGWRFHSDSGTFWQWSDQAHGNHIGSLASASVFALTIGALEYEQTLAYLELLRKDRLVNTGVLGVFYRRGLREAYQVILNGQVIEFPYANGKGFTRAVKAAKAMKQPWVTALFEKLAIWPCLTHP